MRGVDRSLLGSLRIREAFKSNTQERWVHGSLEFL